MAQSPKDIDVLVAGGAGIDTIVHVPTLPLPMADSIHVPPAARWSCRKAPAAAST